MRCGNFSEEDEATRKAVNSDFVLSPNYWKLASGERDRRARQRQFETRAFNFTLPASMLTVYSTSLPPFDLRSFVLLRTNFSKS